jgi:formylglycine-generating enzyme required for sulfatase activity
MDTHEASPSDGCTVASPQSEVDTQQNLSDATCVAASKENVTPWRFVSFMQAQQLCARGGKRLPTNEEWYNAASGITEIEQCAIDVGSSPVVTGSAACATPSGIYDMIGNVWEWIDEEVVDGTYNDRLLPETGYVSLVDGDGVVVETSDRPSAEFGEDYAWINKEGLHGMIRGGFYGSREDAGIFTLNASVPLDFKAVGVGFRCVRGM